MPNRGKKFDVSPDELGLFGAHPPTASTTARAESIMITLVRIVTPLRERYISTFGYTLKKQKLHNYPDSC